ncbi:hypothetical protein BDQ17DRAFT_1487844 [Cyathus striatus]|nr:hypothetical protein BDQ17DRAFT_1487844 [Cyathus striatus]
MPRVTSLLHTPQPPTDCSSLLLPDNIRPEFTLLVAGCRGGKTSFLRLLLDTSDIHSRASKDQLASVAKFVQGSSGHTSFIRTASIDINVDDANGGKLCLGLSLIDTPSLDFRDEPAAERQLTETIRYIDSRFAEGLDDEWKAKSGDRYVHLCIYFLDPDQIVPAAVPAPPAPLVPRARTGSLSQPDQEPVILEPPVTTNPLLYRPTLPAADVSAIRRLSRRVNVLPVIARADILSNDRLNAVKMAIRRDLADAGIGFGIFDVDGHYPQDDHPPQNGTHPNGSSSNANSPPASPVAPAQLRLPYALVSPDIYSHSDGVPRPHPPRHELVQMYTPPPSQYPAVSKLARGKFLRSYRWGTLDVLEPTHSDFLPLRSAIFHHMETLQKYTREYLFDKFCDEYNHQQQRPPSRPSISHIPHMVPIPHNSRPILAIDTAPHTSVPRHPSLSGPRDILAGDVRPTAMPRPPPDSISAGGSAKSAGPRTNKQRSKKITVACNFCRSRKLKCDGGRPACGQCMKRSNPCDYMPQNKRRTTVRQRKGEESESESADERSAEPEQQHSLSPEVSAQPLPRRSSNVDKLAHEGYGPGPLPPMASLPERRDEHPMPGPSRSKPMPVPEGRTYFPDNELPHIATLSLPAPSPSTPAPMSAPSLPPIRPASDQQAAQRKRAATVPGKRRGNLQARVPKLWLVTSVETKCDGAHPACASCARRQLPCNYVHDTSGAPNGVPQKKGRRPSTSKPSANSQSVSPPSSRMIPTPSTGNDHLDHRELDDHLDDEVDLKRPLEHPDMSRAAKKMRMDSSPVIAGIP